MEELPAARPCGDRLTDRSDRVVEQEAQEEQQHPVQPASRRSRLTGHETDHPAGARVDTTTHSHTPYCPVPLA